MSGNLENHGRAWLESAALAAVWRNKRVWLVQSAANALFLGLAFLWLWIPDATGLQLTLTVVLAAVVVLGSLWLQGATLIFFRRWHSKPPAGFGRAGADALRRFPALFAWLAVSFLLYAATLLFATGIAAVAYVVGSVLTFLLRVPIGPESIAEVFTATEVVVAWVLVPIFLLPLGCVVADEGFVAFRGRGWLTMWRATRHFRYWMNYLAVFLICAYVPSWLILWVPQLEGLLVETLSLIARFTLAFVLFVTGWLYLTAVVGRVTAPSPATESESQPPAASEEAGSAEGV